MIEQISSTAQTVFKVGGETYTVTYYPDVEAVHVNAEVLVTSIEMSKEAFNHIAEWLDKQPSPVGRRKDDLIQRLFDYYVEVVTTGRKSSEDFNGFYYCYHNLGPKAYWSIQSGHMEELARTFTIISTADWLLEHTKDG